MEVSYAISTFEEVAKAVCHQIGAEWKGDHYLVPAEIGYGKVLVVTHSGWSCMLSLFQMRHPVKITRTPAEETKLVLDLLITGSFDLEVPRRTDRQVHGNWLYISNTKYASSALTEPGKGMFQIAFELPLETLRDLKWTSQELNRVEELDVLVPVESLESWDAYILPVIDQMYTSNSSRALIPLVDELLQYILSKAQTKLNAPV